MAWLRGMGDQSFAVAGFTSDSAKTPDWLRPADAERLAPRGAHLDRHLVGSAADAARTYLDRGHHIVERLLEYGDRILPGFAFDDVERAIDNIFRHRLLAGMHHRIHEFGDDDVAKFGIRQNVAFIGPVAAGHFVTSFVSRSFKNAKRPIIWVALLRISIVAVCGFSRLAYRAHRAGCGSARRASPSRGRRGS